MKTKTLLLTAALGLLGATASFAQVYSVNAVGYINQTATAGKYDIWANQLNNGDNKIGTVIPAAPEGSLVQTFDNASQSLNQAQLFTGGTWYNAEDLSESTVVLNPGTGFFFYATEDGTVTFVGDVPQGDGLTVPLAPGLNLVGSIVPQAGTLSALGLTAPSVGDFAQMWNKNDPDTATFPAGNLFQPVSYPVGDGQWYDADLNVVPEPSVAVGQGFFYNNSGGTTWTRNFHVNP